MTTRISFLKVLTQQTHICSSEQSQISNSGKRKMNCWSVIFSYAASVHIVFSPLPTRFGDGHLIFTLQVLDANMIITGAFIHKSFRPSLNFQPLQITTCVQAILTYAASLPLKEAASGAVPLPLLR